MEHYEQILYSIIKAQEAIIGPIAYDEARKTGLITIDPKTKQMEINGDPKIAIETLVKQYADLFGKISIEVSKEAALTYVSNLKETISLPPSLN